MFDDCGNCGIPLGQDDVEYCARCCRMLTPAQTQWRAVLVRDRLEEQRLARCDRQARTWAAEQAALVRLGMPVELVA
jgi:hypothetical protein